jgi:hypothetical protein
MKGLGRKTIKGNSKRSESLRRNSSVFGRFWQFFWFFWLEKRNRIRFCSCSCAGFDRAVILETSGGTTTQYKLWI